MPDFPDNRFRITTPTLTAFPSYLGAPGALGEQSNAPCLKPGQLGLSLGLPPTPFPPLSSWNFWTLLGLLEGSHLVLRGSLALSPDLTQADPPPLTHMNQCGDIGFLLGLRVTDTHELYSHTSCKLPWKWRSLRMGSGCWAVCMPWPLYRWAAVPSFPCARPADSGWSWTDRTRRVGALFAPDLEAIPLALRCMQRGGPGCCFLAFIWGGSEGRRERNQPTEIGLLDGFF